MMLKALWDLSVAQGGYHLTNNVWECQLMECYIIRKLGVRNCCILNGAHIPLGSSNVAHAAQQSVLQ
jgi:hypothetical protein